MAVGVAHSLTAAVRNTKRLDIKQHSFIWSSAFHLQVRTRIKYDKVTSSYLVKTWLPSCEPGLGQYAAYTHTHTHTHTNIYICNRKCFAY